MRRPLAFLERWSEHVLMLRAIRPWARAALGGLLVFTGLHLASCFVDPMAILGSQVSQQFGFSKESVFIRIVNRSGEFTQEVQLRVDNQLVTLPACAPTTSGTVCDSILSTCPTTIEVVSETRLDKDLHFAGGRSFNGNEAYIFRQGEFECGATIVLEFTDTEAKATILN